MSANINRNWIYNPPQGGPGGDDFEATPADDNATVTKIEVWCQDSPGGHYSLSGLRITWSSGQTSRVYGSEHDYNVFDFAKGDQVTTMFINAGGRADRVDLHTNKGHHFSAGGTGGIGYTQNIGNGKLVGFWGRAGNGIDALGSVFQK
ncbi:Jacalin-like lectin domain-containing protein [Aspergillus pseudocaelatus]|uniref:Jacalin-like lectin domain-containing protein n=1 Tax=Aspergillus pseudocaelatus TaxID=1825620 RepID=A0ABQ6WTU5_9EURO|nr:Jacalin-like lectin domain-containing protein [Aspergillus pseudocaelatus]